MKLKSSMFFGLIPHPLFREIILRWSLIQTREFQFLETCDNLEFTPQETWHILKKIKVNGVFTKGVRPMAKSKSRSSKTQTTKGGYFMYNTALRRTAIIVLSIIMVLSIIGTGLFLAFFPDVSAKANTTTTIQATNTTSSDVPSIGIRDLSVSMKNYMVAVPGYDTWNSFGADGTSRITTEVVKALDNGYKRVGVVTDLESWPQSEVNSIVGRHYSNVELTFFVPNNVEQQYLNQYINIYKAAMDPSTCTLKFVDMAGNEMNVAGSFDNYTSATDDKNPSTVTVTSSYEEGNSVPRSVVIIGLEALFLVIMGLIIVILALCGRCCCGFVGVGTTNVPQGVQRALKADALALDGSSSVSHIYQDFINWAKNSGWNKVYRFASQVEELNISKAERIPADGNTAGYTAFKMMFDAGNKVVTVVTDGGFNDEASIADGVIFEKIYFVGENISESDVEHLKIFCKDFEIVSI